MNIWDVLYFYFVLSLDKYTANLDHLTYLMILYCAFKNVYFLIVFIFNLLEYFNMI